MGAQQGREHSLHMLAMIMMLNQRSEEDRKQINLIMNRITKIAEELPLVALTELLNSDPIPSMEEWLKSGMSNLQQRETTQSVENITGISQLLIYLGLLYHSLSAEVAKQVGKPVCKCGEYHLTDEDIQKATECGLLLDPSKFTPEGHA